MSSETSQQLFERHMRTETQTKELNNMLSTKYSSLKSERNKTIHQFFHSQVLRTMTILKPKTYHKLIKKLSVVYRNNKTDLQVELNGIINVLNQLSNEEINANKAENKSRSVSPVKVSPVKPSPVKKPKKMKNINTDASPTTPPSMEPMSPHPNAQTPKASAPRKPKKIVKKVQPSIESPKGINPDEAINEQDKLVDLIYDTIKKARK